MKIYLDMTSNINKSTLLIFIMWCLASPWHWLHNIHTGWTWYKYGKHSYRQLFMTKSVNRLLLYHYIVIWHSSTRDISNNYSQQVHQNRFHISFIHAVFLLKILVVCISYVVQCIRLHGCCPSFLYYIHLVWSSPVLT